MTAPHENDGLDYDEEKEMSQVFPGLALLGITLLVVGFVLWVVGI